MQACIRLAKAWTPHVSLSRIDRVAFQHALALAAYPDRVIRIVVPFAPGGGTDVVARALAQEMAKDLGASVIIENKPGAGTILGTQMVAASRRTATRC